MAENRNGRPTSAKVEAANVSGDNLDNINGATDRRVYQRQHWAFPLIRRGGPDTPAYGSDAWLALAESDPAKIAGCVRAAELYARQGDNLVEDLRTEVEESRRAYKATEDAAYVARREAHRAEWKHLRLVRGMAYADAEEFRSGGEPA